MMKISMVSGCYKLDTAVCCIGLCLTVLYLLLGLGSVVWLVLCNTDTTSMVMEIREAYMMRMQTMMGSLALMGTVLVIAFIGLLTCLLLILGVKTEQRLLLLPWQVYHATIILGCFGGGFYQALHFSVLAERDDSLLACLALFPVVGGIFFIFIWLLVHQLVVRMRYRRQVDRIVEEKRASLASIHHTLQKQVPSRFDQGKPNNRSKRSTKKTKERLTEKYKSEENILTASGAGTLESPYYWVAGRARSLPRHLDRTGERESYQGGRKHCYAGGGRQSYEGDKNQSRDTSMNRIKSQPDISARSDARDNTAQIIKREKDLYRSCHNLYRQSDTHPSNYHDSLWLEEKHKTQQRQTTSWHSLQRHRDKQDSYQNIQLENDKQAINNNSGSEGYHRHVDTQTGSYSLHREGGKHHCSKTVSIDPEVTQYTYQHREHG